MLTPEQSNPQNNPNHPHIRCVDAQSTIEDAMVSANEANVCAPFRVFDILNQEYVGPDFHTHADAIAHMASLGGEFAPNTKI